MRIMILSCALVASGWMLSGCAGMSKSPAIATYTCPDCKDTIEWQYPTSAGKPLLTQGRKVVKHSCPSCKMQWESGVSAASACASCAKEPLTCPVCLKK